MRRTEDQAPGAPDALLARTRHHILAAGSVLVENWDAVVVWLTVSGAEKFSAVSIWIVYVAAPVTLLQSKLMA